MTACPVGGRNRFRYRERDTYHGMQMRVSLFSGLCTFLVCNSAGSFASRLAACLALAAAGVRIVFDAGSLNGLNVFHWINPPCFNN